MIQIGLELSIIFSKDDGIITINLGLSLKASKGNDCNSDSSEISIILENKKLSHP